MIDITSIRKNKILLSDYNYRKDIENRLLMAGFSSLELEVLEEIIYSSLSIPVKKLAKNVDIEEQELITILDKFSKTKLLSFDEDLIIVDKEMRKYYETQILKFDEEYEMGMEFLQSLLRKVPIQVLPTWYSIPRTSNNIFDSIIEKYLLTPQIFQRYLMELNFPDPILNSIVQDVYNAPDFKVQSQTLIEKYGLSKEAFEENLLLLEFNFVCCLGYEKINDTWKEVVTPFYEYRRYLQFLRDTKPTPITSIQMKIKPFAFVQDMSALLQKIKKEPLSNPDLKNPVISKLRLLKLADLVDGRLYALDAANDWLDMPLENRALFIYRHPLNRISSPLFTEKNIREAEKSITRVLNSGWVYFDDFIKGVLIPLNDSSIMLKKVGRTWKYTLPEYSEAEIAFIKTIIFEWLYFVGITTISEHEGRDCFCVTPFGQSLFGR